jgi:hypothetical protein
MGSAATPENSPSRFFATIKSSLAAFTATLSSKCLGPSPTFADTASSSTILR